MKRKRLKQLLCALLTVSMMAGQPLSLLAAEETVTDVGDEGFFDAQEPVEDVEQEEVQDVQEDVPQVSDDADSVFSDASDLAQTDPLFGDGSTEAEQLSDPEQEEPEELLSFREYLESQGVDIDSLSKEERMHLYEVYQAYVRQYRGVNQETAQVYSSGRTWLRNNYLEAVVAGNGKFTMGTLEGNPNYTSDNDKKLLFGHPNPSTSETLIKIGEQEMFFEADTVNSTGNKIISSMTYNGIQIIQTMELVKSGNASYADTVRISYQVMNGSGETADVGIRIMLDTMLANNDDAPFRIPGVGNQTTIRTFRGSEIPQSYQVYDRLDNPTTLATGYLYRGNERRPDVVYFTNWPSIHQSYWNYYPSEGSSLGDSAVAVRFDPKSLAPGKSMEVSTYYGVSVGNSIISGSGSQSIGKDQCLIRVKNTTTEEALGDVNVVITGQNGQELRGTTDENGDVLFDNIKDIAGEVNINISKDKYRSKIIRKNLQGGEALVFSLKKLDDTTPEIISVTLGDKNLLTDTVSYLEDSSSEIAKAKNTKTVTLKVESDEENCVYFLMQDESVVAKNDTGVFEFKTLEKKNGTVIEKLTSQSKRYVKCVSKDGKASKNIQFGLKVSKPVTSAKGITKMKFMTMGEGSVAKTSLAALFMGDALKFGMNDLLDLEVKTDDNGKVSVGLNLKAMPKSQKEKDKLNKELLQSRADDFKLGKKQPKLHIGSLKTTFNVAGYGEGYLEDGKVMVNLIVRACGSVSATYTTDFFWIVPTYISVSGEGKIEAEIRGNIVNQNGLNLNGLIPKWTSGTIAPSISVALEGGVGAKGIANFGAEGRGTVKYTADLVKDTQLCELTASASLKGAIWKFEKSLKLAEATVTVYDSNRKNRAAAYCQDQNIYEELNAQPFLLEAEGGTETDNGLTSSADSSPILVNAGGTNYKFWIHEDSSQQVCNNNQLVYQKDGQTGYTVIDNDGTSDFAPAVAVDEANKVIYVAWQDTKQAFNDSSVTVDDMANASEICVAVIRYGSGSDVIRTYTLTNNNVTDTIPAIAVKNGLAYVAWYHTENGALQTTLSGYVYYTSMNANGNTGSVKSVNIGTNRYVSQISVSASGNGPVVTYTFTKGEGMQALVDVDETRQSGYIQIDTGATGNLGTEEGSAKSGIITGSLSGTDYMFWYQDGNIAYKANVDDETSYVFDPENLPENLSENFQVISSQAKTYILWIAADPSDQTVKSAYGCVWENGAFGKVHCLCSMGAGTISDLSGTFDQDGRLVLSYHRVELGENGETKNSVLAEKTVNGFVDLKIQSVEFEDSDVADYQTLPMTVTIKNNGSMAADGIDFTYTYEDEYAELGKEHKDVVIQPGEEKKIQVDFPLSKLDVEDEAEIYGITASASFEGNTSVDRTEFELGYRVLYAEQLDDVMMDNQEYVVIQVVNDSKLTTENVGFRILADAKDGAVLYTENMGDMEAGAVKTIYFPRSTMNGCKAAYLYLSTDSPRRNEEQAYSLLSNSSESIRMITTSSFEITAGQGGSVNGQYEKTYDSDTEVKLSATAKAGYVFDHWTANEGVIDDEDSSETTFIMPETDAQVTALFMKEKKATAVSVPAALELFAGDQKQLDVAVTPSDASDKCTYTTEQTDIISVSKKGEIEALKAGTAQITVKCGAYSATCNVTVKDVPVTDIRMVYPTLELGGIGAKDTVEVLLMPSNATEAITYTSSHPEIVTVDQNGTVTAQAMGEAEITVSTKSGVKGICKVQVANPLTGIQFNESTLRLKKDETVDLNVNFQPLDTTEKQGIDWIVYDPDVAVIDNTYGDNNSIATIRAISSGTTLVEASIGNTFHAYCNISVYIPAERLTLSQQSIILKEGYSEYLEWTLYPSQADDKVTFTSSNENVARVYNSGEVYGRNPGSAVITAATENGLTASCQVTVVDPADNVVNVTELSQFQSDHPYSNNEDKTWSYHVEGAGSVSITFSADTKTEEDYDYIYIMDGAGNRVGAYSGTELQNRTITVSGSTIKVRLKSDSSEREYGFRVVSATGTVSIANAQIGAIPNQYYTGSAIMPAISVTHMGRMLTAGVDYTVSYYSNINVGKATAVITGMGSFSGTATIEFYIVKPNLQKVTGGKTVNATQKSLTIGWNPQVGATGYYVYRYEASKKKYVLRTTLNGSTSNRYTDKDRKLKYGTKYRYQIVPFFIQGSISAKGSAAVIESTLAPKTAAISRVTAGKKSLTVKYGRISRVNGYEVYVSTRRGSGYKLAATVKKGTVTTATAKRLTSRKVYYVKVRAFISTKSGKVYGAYSSPKKVRVK